jgi:hypothetical protein
MRLPCQPCALAFGLLNSPQYFTAPERRREEAYSGPKHNHAISESRFIWRSLSVFDGGVAILGSLPPRQDELTFLQRSWKGISDGIACLSWRSTVITAETHKQRLLPYDLSGWFFKSDGIKASLSIAGCSDPVMGTHDCLQKVALPMPLGTIWQGRWGYITVRLRWRVDSTALRSRSNTSLEDWWTWRRNRCPHSIHLGRWIYFSLSIAEIVPTWFSENDVWKDDYRRIRHEKLIPYNDFKSKKYKFSRGRKKPIATATTFLFQNLTLIERQTDEWTKNLFFCPPKAIFIIMALREARL